MRTIRAAGQARWPFHERQARAGTHQLTRVPATGFLKQASPPAASIPRRRASLQPGSAGSVRPALRRVSAGCAVTAAARNRRSRYQAGRVRRDCGAVSAPAGSVFTRVARPPARAAFCTGGKSHRIPAPRASVQRRGRKERCSWSARSRLILVPAFAGQASRPVRRSGWIRTGVRFAGCGTLLLYRGPKPWDRAFDFMALTWVELWGFEPQTSCMPSAGNTSTAVRSRRSPSRSVHSSLSRSGQVAVLPCCTPPRVRRSPRRLRYFPPCTPRIAPSAPRTISGPMQDTATAPAAPGKTLGRAA
jgi:hypothetical protein